MVEILLFVFLGLPQPTAENPKNDSNFVSIDGVNYKKAPTPWIKVVNN